MKLPATAASSAWDGSFSASAILRSASSSSVESAPCLLPLPTSSLSNRQYTFECSPGAASRNARREVYAHSRSSSLGAQIYSPAAPTRFALSRLYRNRSHPAMLSRPTPAAFATISI